MKTQAYKAVACELVDHVEIIATTRRKVYLKYNSTFQSASIEIRTTIMSWTTRNKVEYLLLSDGEEIRMDRIVILDEFESGSASCGF